MSEDTLQMALVSMIKTFYPDILISLSLSGINLKGSVQEKSKEIAKMKKLGLVRGLPDLTLYLPESKILNVELKTEIGKQSPDQKLIESKLKSLGHNYYLVRSTAEVFGLISKHTSSEFRKTQFNQLSIPSSGGYLTSKFLYFPKGTPTELIKTKLKEYYDLCSSI